MCVLLFGCQHLFMFFGAGFLWPFGGGIFFVNMLSTLWVSHARKGVDLLSKLIEKRLGVVGIL